MADASSRRRPRVQPLLHAPVRAHPQRLREPLARRGAGDLRARRQRRHRGRRTSSAALDIDAGQLSRVLDPPRRARHPHRVARRRAQAAGRADRQPGKRPTSRSTPSRPRRSRGRSTPCPTRTRVLESDARRSSARSSRTTRSSSAASSPATSAGWSSATASSTPASTAGTTASSGSWRRSPPTSTRNATAPSIAEHNGERAGMVLCVHHDDTTRPSCAPCWSSRAHEASASAPASSTR